mmetsp:Transcript_54404/g.140554  ORF Transcript_54404/g.140554 Transcript_54404/m.140554 type:complete len:84 (+) Transcript_54404:66-317(+)
MHMLALLLTFLTPSARYTFASGCDSAVATSTTPACLLEQLPPRTCDVFEARRPELHTTKPTRYYEKDVVYVGELEQSCELGTR